MPSIDLQFKAAQLQLFELFGRQWTRTQWTVTRQAAAAAAAALLETLNLEAESLATLHACNVAHMYGNVNDVGI